MLKSLHIQNYVLIDSLEVCFPEGLSIITGQTGAGKSILLGALSLLTGAKGDASLISDGASSCVVEGLFSAPESVRAAVEEADVEWDDGNLLVRRVLNASGRSRAFVNDSPVNVQLLQDISSSLVDIHSQHQSLRLADRRFQMEVQDFYAGCSPLVEECSQVWNSILSRKKELGQLKDKLARLQADKEYNSARFEMLDSAHLRDGELEELEAEQKLLASAESIKENLSAVEAIMNPEEGPGMESALKEAERLLEKLSKIVPGTEELAERLHSTRIEIDDIAQTVSDINSHTDLSQERLEQVEERMGLLYSLMQKHACSSVAELIAARDSYAEALFDSTALEEKISTIEKELATSERTHLDLCKRIHTARSKAAPELASGIEKDLRFLELDRAVFEVDIEDAAPSATGADGICFKFSSTGSTPVDVARCASGGEISRIMLTLKALMARFTGMPTMIFDEIDSGVSGSAADKMGQMICNMGKDMQVFAITHLPQVAAKGSAHFVVEKSASDTGAVSVMRRLDDEERIREIARLLSGSTITPEAVANARRLIAAE